MYEAPDGKRYRPSMFLTLTCDGYGKVTGDGTPVDPASYDYQRAARDALHSKDASRCIGYLTKYLTKQVADCHTPRHHRPASARRPAGRGAALRAVLADVPELAAVWHPA